MKFPLFTSLLPAFYLMLAPVVHAHSVWIESDPEGKMMVRFGEWGDEVEKSPGHLDGLAVFSAWNLGGDGKISPWAIQKKSDHFLLSSDVTSPSMDACAEAAYMVLAAPGKTARKPLFYARWHRGAAAAVNAALTFDIVPTGQPGEVKVYFRRSPLAGVKITVHVPGAPDQEITTDSNGAAHFEGSKKGLYLLTCSHQRESTPGYSEGVAYDQVSHNCSLAWLMP